MKKGFTLIELLAVIIILAVIALIATPVVLNVIENSKKEAFKEMRNGKKITCKNWTLILGKSQYLYVKNDEIYFYDGIVERKVDRIYTENILTSEWEIVE